LEANISLLGFNFYIILFDAKNKHAFSIESLCNFFKFFSLRFINGDLVKYDINDYSVKKNHFEIFGSVALIMQMLIIKKVTETLY
jgi:hypothetical protein